MTPIPLAVVLVLYQCLRRSRACWIISNIISTWRQFLIPSIYPKKILQISFNKITRLMNQMMILKVDSLLQSSLIQKTTLIHMASKIRSTKLAIMLLSCKMLQASTLLRLTSVMRLIQGLLMWWWLKLKGLANYYLLSSKLSR